MNRLCLIIAFLFLSALGCNRNVSFGGKVTFPDGSVPPGGQVVFTTDTFMARAPIERDGSYSLYCLSKGDGIPPGTYRVAVQNIEVERQDFRKQAEKKVAGALESSGPDMTVIPRVSLIDSKYQTGDMSGLVCEVKTKGTFDIVLEPSEYWKKNYEGKK